MLFAISLQLPCSTFLRGGTTMKSLRLSSMLPFQPSFQKRKYSPPLLCEKSIVITLSQHVRLRRERKVESELAMQCHVKICSFKTLKLLFYCLRTISFSSFYFLL